MRRVGVAWMGLVALAGQAIAVEPEAAASPSAVPLQPTAVESMQAETAPKADASAPAKDDYYTRRAKTVIEAEKASAVTPHPLAARYPGKDVIVCEAGCPDRKGPQVVSLRPSFTPASKEVAGVAETREGKMVPTSESAPSSEPVCVAGCYSEAAMTDAGTDQEPAHEPDSTWYPSTPPTPVPPRDKLSPVR